MSLPDMVICLSHQFGTENDTTEKIFAAPHRSCEKPYRNTIYHGTVSEVDITKARPNNIAFKWEPRILLIVSCRFELI